MEQEKTNNSQKPLIVQLALPISIIVAGLMISGTLLYAKGVFNKTNTATNPAELNVANLKKWAKTLKIDTKQFNTCLDSNKYKEKVSNDIAYGTELGVNGTPSFFINGVAVVGAQPIETFNTTINDALAGKINKKAISVKIDPSDHVIGNANATVTIVEFSDFQCPFCLRFYEQTYLQLKSTYIDTGKVKLIFKHFPLSIHAGAQPAAEASECAGEQGKFWEMHDLIFKNQAGI